MVNFVKESLVEVWENYTSPEYIINSNHASDGWKSILNNFNRCVSTA